MTGSTNDTGDVHQVGAQVAIAITGSVGGSIEVTYVLPDAFHAEAFPLADPANDILPQTGPSGLLAASSRIVPFVGRVTELGKLRAWRDTPDALSVMLVHGPGGQGKTRLAARFAQLSAAEGWAVAQARHHTDPAIAADEHEPAGGTRGLLVVVDYAERWPRLDLERLFRAPFLRQGVPVRLLLLARPAGYWWRSLLNPLAKLSARASDLELGPLADDVADRQRVFAAARDEFARRLGCGHVTDLQAAGSLTDEAYALALTLHMAALVAVDARSRGATAPAHPDALSAYLIARERDHWATMYANGRVAQPDRVMGRLVGLATLTRPLPNAAAAVVVADVGLAETSVGAQALLDDHSVCYPPSATGTALEPLFPDRLGEDHIAELLSPGGDDGWSIDLPAKLIKSGTGAPSHSTAALAVLVETGKRWEHVREEYLFPLLRTRPELVTLATGASLVTLAEYADPDVLAELDRHLLRDTTVDLDTGSAVIARRLAEHGVATAAGDAVRATLFNRLAVRSINAGLYPDAVTAARQAVALREQLAANDPAHEPDLAAAVSTLAVALSSSGDVTAAIEAGRRAVDLRKRLVAHHAGAYEADLALSLTNLSVFLSDSDEFDDAVAVAQESVDIHRRLVDVAARPYTADLAMSMANLGRALSKTGRYREGAEAAREAVAKFRSLAATDPSFAASLARSLVNLRVNLAGLAEREETQEIAREAVELYRELASTMPAVYVAELAEALSSLTIHLVDHQNIDEALTTAQEAVDLQRELAAVDPAAHGPGLARMLTTLATALLSVGSIGSAILANEEAVAIHRARVPSDDLGLARALFHLSESLAVAGRNNRALKVVEEAVALRRGRTGERTGIAELLIHSATVLTDLDRMPEAVTALRQAADECRDLSRDEPSYAVDLAEILGDLAEKLAHEEHHDEVIAVTQEAAVIWRGMVSDDADAVEPLTHCLRLLSASLAHVGRLSDALDHTEELLRLMTLQDADEPDVYLGLNQKVLILLDLDRPKEALAPSAEAVTGWRRLADADPASYEPYLAGALSDQAVALLRADELTEAETTAVEALRLWTTLAEELVDFEEEAEQTRQTLAEIRLTRRG